eukprot:10919423-Ditylum_brightwellii.AAC.1
MCGGGTGDSKWLAGYQSQLCLLEDTQWHVRIVLSLSHYHKQSLPDRMKCCPPCTDIVSPKE